MKPNLYEDPILIDKWKALVAENKTKIGFRDWLLLEHWENKSRDTLRMFVRPLQGLGQISILKAAPQAAPWVIEWQPEHKDFSSVRFEADLKNPSVFTVMAFALEKMSATFSQFASIIDDERRRFDLL
jgi:hypothetical protein